MDRREEIYDKALELFIAEGYDNTPLSRIARELNLTKAGLYHYVSSKEELLFIIHKRKMEKAFLPVLKEAKGISDPGERIEYFIRNYTLRSLTQDASTRVLIHEVKHLKPAHRKVIRKVWREAFEMIRDALTEMEAAGRTVPINKSFASFAALGMCSWTFYWFDYDRKESRKELADVYVRIFLKGLLADNH